MRAGGGSREYYSERGIGGSGGIVMDVDFVGSGCGVLLSKIIRKKKAVFGMRFFITTFLSLHSDR